MQWFLKMLCGMVNSLDLDQTASSDWVCTAGFATLSETLVHEILVNIP